MLKVRNSLFNSLRKSIRNLAFGEWIKLTRNRKRLFKALLRNTAIEKLTRLMNNLVLPRFTKHNYELSTYSFKGIQRNINRYSKTNINRDKSIRLRIEPP